MPFLVGLLRFCDAILFNWGAFPWVPPLGQDLFRSGAQSGCWPFSTQDPAGVFSLLILQFNIAIYKVHPGEM